MKREVIVLKTSELNSNLINEINILKNSHWVYGIKEQNEWFKKNIKKEDTHFIVRDSKKVIGYNCIRKYIFKRKKYYLFDTFIINNKFRNKGLSKLIMEKNIIFYKNKKLPFILFCNNELINFYQKFGWKKNQNFKDLKKRKSLLIFKN